MKSAILNDGKQVHKACFRDTGRFISLFGNYLTKSSKLPALAKRGPAEKKCWCHKKLQRGSSAETQLFFLKVCEIPGYQDSVSTVFLRYLPGEWMLQANPTFSSSNASRSRCKAEWSSWSLAMREAVEFCKVGEVRKTLPAHQTITAGIR